MAFHLYRLGKLAYRRRRWFVAAWLVVLIGMGILTAVIAKPLNDSFSIPGIPSEQAQTLQQKLFPGTGNALEEATGTAVFAAPEGRSLAEPAYRAAVDAVIAELRDVPQMGDTQRLVNPVDASAAQYEMALKGGLAAGKPQAVAEADARALLPLTADSRIGTATWKFDVATPVDVEQSTKDAVERAAESGRDGGLQVEFMGSGLQGPPQMNATSELLGLAVAAIVLVLTFGSLIAAGLPLLTAVVGIGIGALAITGATAFTDIGSTTPVLAVMLGLAVGIDYSLFVLSRYRHEITLTDDREEAIGRAVGTAGSAVVFAGLTVVIALAALAVVGIPFLTSMGLAAAGTVTVAVLIALTLLPAILGLVGGKAFAGRVPFVGRRATGDPEAADERSGGVRWARLVGKAPLVWALVAVIGLGVLAVPAKNLQLSLPSDSTAPAQTTQRKAADLVDEGFGAGRNAPLLVVVDASSIAEAPARQAAYGKVLAWAAQHDNVANVQIVGMNKAGDGAQMLLTPTGGPDSTETLDLLQDLRDGQGSVAAATGTRIGVTGLTAVNVDVSERLSDAMPVYLAVVIGLAFVLLMLVFRSILVPLTATLGFLLSVLATFGATVLIFQEGVGGLADPAPMVSFLPILLIGIVFGLAMDYQVFLVSRMREAYVHGASAREAVVEGFRHGSRVVAAAAAIMISVFAAFMLQETALVKAMGFALAAAVFFDAFVVRMTLIPALMKLMGDKAWWLPRWLDRILPDVDIEGERLNARAPSHAQETVRV
jgi:RND superfamily putative drug exporter